MPQRLSIAPPLRGGLSQQEETSLDPKMKELLMSDMGLSSEEADDVLSDPELRMRAYMKFGRINAGAEPKAQIEMKESPYSMDKLKSAAKSVADPLVEYGSAAVPLATTGAAMGSALGPVGTAGGALLGGALGAGMAYGANKLTGTDPKWDSLQNLLNLIPGSAAGKLLPFVKSKALREAMGAGIDNAAAAWGDAKIQGNESPTKEALVGATAGFGASVIPGVVRRGYQAAGERKAVRDLLDKFGSNTVVRDSSGRMTNIAPKRDEKGRFVSGPKESIGENVDALVNYDTAVKQHAGAAKDKFKQLLEEFNAAKIGRNQNVQTKLDELTTQQTELQKAREKALNTKFTLVNKPRQVALPDAPNKTKLQLQQEAEDAIPIPEILGKSKSQLYSEAKAGIPEDPRITRGEQLKSRGLEWKTLTAEERDTVKQLYRTKPQAFYKHTINELFSAPDFPSAPKRGETFAKNVKLLQELEGSNSPKTVMPKLRQEFLKAAFEPKRAGNNSGYANPDSLKKLIEVSGEDTINAIFGNKHAYEDLTKVLSAASRLGVVGKHHAMAGKSGLKIWGIPIAGPKELFTDSRKHVGARVAAGLAGEQIGQSTGNSMLGQIVGKGSAAASVYSYSWDKFAEAVLDKEAGSRFKKYFIDASEPLAKQLERRISNTAVDYF